MMYVRTGQLTYSTEWHVGQGLDFPLARVMSFQVDGDELELILKAMKGWDKRKKINPKTNKIEAIKVVREFCQETFGVISGLKESKDLVDNVISNLPSEAELFKVGDRFNRTNNDDGMNYKLGIWIALSIRELGNDSHPQLVTLIHANSGKTEEFSGYWLQPGKLFDKL